MHQLIENCILCSATLPLQPSRKVSTFSLSRNFNEVVCIDHFYLNGVQLLICIDSATRFSAGYVVGSSALDEAVLDLMFVW